MKSSRIILALAVVLSIVSLPLFAAGQHGSSVQGKIGALDQSAKTFRVNPKKGSPVDLTWNDATKVNHPPLSVGEQVTVRYMAKDGKNVATVVNSAAPKAAKAAAKPTSKPTPKNGK
jgi:hypothetical protein